ncbi:DUF4253 domain-containing protein [Micropruina sp.]|uniref:DUF4253 domain-containing protein n=1 Tax=Micropruina sp. TaxID=2737536 RepID=UPI0039E72050
MRTSCCSASTVLPGWRIAVGWATMTAWPTTSPRCSSPVATLSDPTDIWWRLVAEHYAFCPDNVEQGTDDLAEYGAEIAGSAEWTFWWD